MNDFDAWARRLRASYVYWPRHTVQGELAGLYPDNGFGPPGDFGPVHPDLAWRPLLDLVNVAGTRDWDRLLAWWVSHWVLTYAPVPEDPPWVVAAYGHFPSFQEAVARDPAHRRVVPIIWACAYEGRIPLSIPHASRPRGINLRPFFADLAAGWMGFTSEMWPPLGVVGVRPPTEEEATLARVRQIRDILDQVDPALRIGTPWDGIVDLVAVPDGAVRRELFDWEFGMLARLAQEWLNNSRGTPVALSAQEELSLRVHSVFGREGTVSHPPRRSHRLGDVLQALEGPGEPDAAETLEDAIQRGRGRPAHVQQAVNLRQPKRRRHSRTQLASPFDQAYGTEDFLGLLWKQLAWAHALGLKLVRCVGCDEWTFWWPGAGQALARPRLCLTCEFELAGPAQSAKGRNAYWRWRQRTQQRGASNLTVPFYLEHVRRR